MSQFSTTYRRNQETLIISTYPPQQCGIATFSRDLREAIVRRMGEESTSIAAVSEEPLAHDYPRAVKIRFPRNDRASFGAVAEYINGSSYDTVCVQHEFGIFGGQEGSYLLDLLNKLRKPAVTTLHTVLADPPEHYLRRLQQVAAASDALVVITPTAVTLLRERYGVDTKKVRVIQHGIPDLPFAETAPYKKRFGVEGRMVLMTFGLIGPSKGIEDMIKAMPAIVERHPEALYMIVGATHPGVIANQGESYRESLQQMVAELGLNDHVIFHNRYLSNEELHDYLQACDIYVTPYPNREQVSSGTLAYATGMGKAVVATSYLYAQDLLSNGRGMLVDFHAPQALTNAINHLIENPQEREAMRRRAYEFGRQMTWDNVALEYLKLFEECATRRFSRLPTYRATVLEYAKQHSGVVARKQIMQLNTFQPGYTRVPSAK